MFFIKFVKKIRVYFLEDLLENVLQKYMFRVLRVLQKIFKKIQIQKILKKIVKGNPRENIKKKSTFEVSRGLYKIWLWIYLYSLVGPLGNFLKKYTFRAEVVLYKILLSNHVWGSFRKYLKKSTRLEPRLPFIKLLKNPHLEPCRSFSKFV